MFSLKKMLPFRKDKANKVVLSVSDESKQDTDLQEELDELTATENPRNVDRAKTEAERTISDATFADIRGITLIERGRCPECGGRTELMVFSRVCTNCGWYRWGSQEAGSCTVILNSGEKIKCDKIFNAKGDQILCVKEDVVQNLVSASSIRRVDTIGTKKSWKRRATAFRRNAQEFAIGAA